MAGATSHQRSECRGPRIAAYSGRVLRWQGRKVKINCRRSHRGDGMVSFRSDFHGNPVAQFETGGKGMGAGFLQGLADAVGRADFIRMDKGNKFHSRIGGEDLFHAGTAVQSAAGNSHEDHWAMDPGGGERRPVRRQLQSRPGWVVAGPGGKFRGWPGGKRFR